MCKICDDDIKKLLTTNDKYKIFFQIKLTKLEIKNQNEGGMCIDMKNFPFELVVPDFGKKRGAFDESLFPFYKTVSFLFKELDENNKNNLFTYYKNIRDNETKRALM